MKRKRRAKGIAALEYGLWPCLGGEPSADTADADRYRWITSPECDFGFIADLRGATKEQWDVAIDKRKQFKAAGSPHVPYTR